MSKQTIIDALVKGGMTQADAEKAVLDITPVGSTDADLMRENNMLKTQLINRESQLRQAVDVVSRANDEKKAKEEADKITLIDSIMIDGKFSKDELTKKSLSELQIIRTTIDKTLERTFASVAAELDEAKHTRKPLLSAGYFDSATQTWKGGIAK
jgi:hypothetical protein